MRPSTTQTSQRKVRLTYDAMVERLFGEPERWVVAIQVADDHVPLGPLCCGTDFDPLGVGQAERLLAEYVQPSL
jgi:hypothetical protein